MAKVINTFTRGVMNKSTEKALIEEGFYIDAQNLQFHTSLNQDGVGRNVRGTSLVSDATDSENIYKCISAVFDRKRNAIIYFLASTDRTKSKIVEYNLDSGATTEVVKDNNGTLNFNPNDYITGVNVIDDLLIFSEWGNNIRKINIDRAKTWPINGFTEDDIKLIRKPPHTKPSITLQDTSSDSNQENFIKEKLISFSYRWKYVDGEYSAIAPFTNVAFEPDTFDYDYAVQINKSMVNRFNQVQIGFNTGSKNVVEVQLLFKESQDTEIFIINDFNKELLGWSNNEERTFDFNNFNSIRGLESTELAKGFDNVPRTARAQDIIQGRLMISNYKEQYNIVDLQGDKINFDYSLAVQSLDILNLSPKQTVKSYRDYEVVLAYLDADLRSTTLFKSLNNTLFIPNNLSTKQNFIDLTLRHNPPAFAKYFRFYIKQSKRGYDQVIPTNFYQDGVYVWIQLESADIDKIQKGDYFIVKSDSQGNTEVTEKAKVLEVESKERNFLETTESEDVRQIPGVYFKIKPDGFRINEDDFETYSWNGSDTSDSSVLGNNIPVIYPPVFYGGGLNDMTSSGTYTGNEDRRYYIEVDSADTTDTFRWSKDGGSTFIEENVPMTSGTPITLEDGIQVTFAALTGHDLNDRWSLTVKCADGYFNENSRAFALFKSVPTRNIRGGARITLIYDEYNDISQYVEATFIASKNYETLEEWFYEDNIAAELSNRGIDEARIRFRHGAVNGGGAMTVDPNFAGDDVMIIKSLGIDNNFLDKDPKVRTTIEVFQSESNIILETEPQDQPSNIFYEIGKTYPIENGYHLGDGANDTNQAATQDLIVRLDWFNAFAWGNGVESYKIRDEFNEKQIDVGSRTSSTSKQEYKEVDRTEDITWSDIYNAESSFNGLNSFNLSLANFIPLDRENGPIRKILSKNNNIIVFQEDAIGRLPYNKNVIYTAEGQAVVQIATNILDKKSYVSYGAGKHGTIHPEGIVSDGFRTYIPDSQRGSLLRLSIDGITEVSNNFHEFEFANLMSSNRNNFLVAAFDQKTREYVLHFPNESKVISFKETPLGFPNSYKFSPDFMFSANNELYSWKNGKMYKHAVTTNANDFYGTVTESKIKFVVNNQFGFEKIFKALGIYSTHPWTALIKAGNTQRTIPASSFRKFNNHWFSEIMGDTGTDTINNNIFGIGSYPIIEGVFEVSEVPASIVVGDTVTNIGKTFSSAVQSIVNNTITLADNITEDSSFLMYSKNQDIDGGNIKGEYLEVELTLPGGELATIKSVKTEVEIINPD